ATVTFNEDPDQPKLYLKELSDFLSHLRIIYGLILEENPLSQYVPSTAAQNIQATMPTDILAESLEVWRTRQMAAQDQEDWASAIYETDYGKLELTIAQINKASPLTLVIRGCAIPLALALIVSGGTLTVDAQGNVDAK